jgi:PAS domain S-box-containing protein
VEAVISTKDWTRAASVRGGTSARRLMQAIWLGTFVVVAVIVGGTVWQAEQNRQQALAAARQNTVNTVHTLNQSVARAIDSADMLMRAVASRLELRLSTGQSGSIWGMVSDLTARMPYVMAVTVMDASTGRSLFQYTASYPPVPEIDDEAFYASRDTRDRTIHVTLPAYDKALGTWVVGISRRISIRTEPYDLVLVTHLSLDCFRRLFEGLDLGAKGSVVLFRNDGVILSRRPVIEEQIGIRLPILPLFRDHVPTSPAGTYEVEAPTDGVNRIVSYRQVDDLPLVILTGVSRDEVLDRWYGQVWHVAVLGIATILVIFALSYWLTRIVRRRDQVEGMLKATLEHMDQGLIMIDKDGVIQVHNGRTAQLLDLPGALLRSRPNLEEVRQYQLARGEFTSARDAARSYGDHGVIGTEFELYERERPNGVVLEVRTVPLPAGGAVRTFTDVTARRKAERTLQQSEARYRVLAENTADMIVRIAPDGTRRYLSPATRETLGFEPEELVGTNAVDFTHPDDVAALQRTMVALARGSVERATETYRFHRKNGEWVWIESNLRLTRDAEGQPSEIIAIMRDVTERQRYQQELRAAKDLAEQALVRAEQANEEKSNFLATMSHEIRTPLNSVLGFTSLLLERPDFPADARRQLQLIQSSGSALLTVVNDVLDFSKIEAGQIDLDPHTFVLPDLIKDTVSIVEGAAAQKQVEISVDLPRGLYPAFVGDGDRVRQILLNFLNNAVKFTRKGYVRIGVDHLGRHAAGERLRFSVTDTGIGIPKDKQERLFRRFSQVDGSIRRKFGGTGLGLAICKHLVELMGGEIGVESEEGVGSTFWFDLTLPQGDMSDLKADAGPQEKIAPSRRARILLVEDLDLNQELAVHILSRAGHVVEVASDGAEALQAVQRASYDMVLMDIQMPVMDGMTATARIRELSGPVQHIPIIAMTANVLPEQIARFKEAGMNDHVGKPFRPTELLDAVERWQPEIVMTEPYTVPARGQEGHGLDRAIFDELVDLIGEQRSFALLGRLEKLLSSRCEGPPATDLTQIASEAHAMVSVAGMLGFKELSDASREVERACLTGAPVEDLLDTCRHLCESALADIAALKVLSRAA